MIRCSSLSLIENLQREDLNPLDAAQGCNVCWMNLGWRKRPRRLLGRSKATLPDLGLLKLLLTSSLTSDRGTHRRSRPPPLPIATRATKTASKGSRYQGLDVRKLEEVIAKQKSGSIPELHQDPNIHRLETVLMEHFAVPVQIRLNQKKGTGSITFRYHSLASVKPS